MSSLEMFGLCFLYSCNLSYFSVKKVLRCSFWSSDSFSSPPSRFNSVAMLLSSSGVIAPLSELSFFGFLLLGDQGLGGANLQRLEGTSALSPCQLLSWLIAFISDSSNSWLDFDGD